MKVVINGCFGGFGLSEKAYEALIERGVLCVGYNSELDSDRDKTAPVIYDNTLATPGDHDMSFMGRYWEGYYRDYDHRCDADLVAVVDALGDDASGPMAELYIVEIPDDVKWEIDDYDGVETIHEVHRSWS